VWLTTRLSGRPPNSPAPLFEGVELLIGAVFIIVGVLGLYVAIMLFRRSMMGFYGSLLLALGLLLVGPAISLVTTPPNYVSMICTGGIAGMIVLLTLAGQPGFESALPNDKAVNQTQQPAKYA